MKKYVLFILFVSSFALLLSACGQSQEEKLQVYLKENSRNFYDLLVVDFIDGEVKIEIKMLPDSESWSNDDAEFDVRLETKSALEAIQKYSNENTGVMIKEANLYFVTRESNKTVAEINVTYDTIMETEWMPVTYQEFLPIIDVYKFYGVSE